MSNNPITNIVILVSDTFSYRYIVVYHATIAENIQEPITNDITKYIIQLSSSVDLALKCGFNPDGHLGEISKLPHILLPHSLHTQ